VASTVMIAFHLHGSARDVLVTGLIVSIQIATDELKITANCQKKVCRNFFEGSAACIEAFNMKHVLES
jgi:hypothetical protein